MLTSAAAAQPAAPPFLLGRRPARTGKDLSCWLALPEEISSLEPPIVAIHGIRRQASEQAALFARRAAVSGRPVIAPLFDEVQWSRYQQVIRRGRADLALLNLMDDLRREGIWRTTTFELFGFSGGAQFAHRFAMLHPDRISRLTVASAGWFTFPDDAHFPYGLAARTGRPGHVSATFRDGLDRFLRLPINVSVGAHDNIVDRNTRSGPEIDAQQGTHRLERAHRWTNALQIAAKARGIEPTIGCHVLPACGHAFRQCVENGGLDRIVVLDAIGAGRPGTDLSIASPGRCEDCSRDCTRLETVTPAIVGEKQ